MSELWSQLATNESRVQPFREPTLQMWRMQASLYAKSQGEGLFPGNPHTGIAHVCGRQQSTVDCSHLENQSAECFELDQRICFQVATCADATQAQGGRAGRVVHLCEAEKNRIYVLTVVDRATHCLLSWDAVSERSSTNLQACLERAPQARQYYSDAFPAYDNLYYGAPYEMRTDKKETYSVEAVNADLRHYLKRLARKSRCYSRRLDALLNNLRLFAYCYNQRQLAKQKYPQYNLPLIDFLYPL